MLAPSPRQRYLLPAMFRVAHLGQDAVMHWSQLHVSPAGLCCRSRSHTVRASGSSPSLLICRVSAANAALIPEQPMSPIMLESRPDRRRSAE